MTNPSSLLKIGVPYYTGPLAWTDLHAGGLFFCVIYRECLEFSTRGRVRRWCEVIDDSRSLDDEAEVLRATNVVGSYRLNERGYLSCVFPDLELTGLPCDRMPEMLVFNAWRTKAQLPSGMVFVRDLLA